MAKRYLIQAIRKLSKPMFTPDEIRAVVKLLSKKNKVYNNYYEEWN